MIANTAVNASATGNASHTPFAPSIFPNRNAAGIMTMTYRSNAIQKRWCTLSESFQCSGAGHRHAGHDKAKADDMKCSDSDPDGLFIHGEQPDQFFRDEPGYQHSGCHHTKHQSQCRPEYFFLPVFSLPLHNCSRSADGCPG